MKLSIDKILRQAQSHIKAGKLAEAEALYKQVLSKFPKNKKALQGYIKLKSGITLKTPEIYKSPEQILLELNNLLNNNQFKEVLSQLKPLLRQFPKIISLYNLQAEANLGLEKYDAAIVSYEHIIKINPNYLEGYNRLGYILREKGDLDAAIDIYKQALKLKPDYAEAYYNMGEAHLQKGDFNPALNCCNNAIRLQPNFKEAQFLKSRLLLNRHEFELGWTLYASSRALHKESTIVFTTRVERWNGSSLRGKNIQVYATQGVGDEIMFSSCIPDLIQKKPKAIYLECDPRLQPLFARSFPEIVTYGKARSQKLAEIFDDANTPIKDAHLDYSIPIDGLPQFFRNRIEDFPKRNYFLIPCPALVNKWSSRLKNLGEGLKIGISWMGGGVKHSETSSVPLHFWREVLSLEAFFVNLQYGEVSAEINRFHNENKIKVYDWEDNDPLLDLDNQAALISQLDLVISVDNATVHSCIAIGTEVWDLMEPRINLMLMDNGTNSSPLSPHLKLFKKKTPTCWITVLKQVEIALRVRTQGS